MSAALPDCAFCAGDGGRVVARTEKFRVVHADEAGFPGFYRVVWNAHLPEFTDLADGDRVLVMAAVAAVEQALRRHLEPTKVNIASLGNLTPHLHWHVVARFAWDSHYPNPVWAQPARPRELAHEAALRERLAVVEAGIQRGLGGLARKPADH